MTQSVQTSHDRFASFADFYPYYLSEHRTPMCRRLHFIGTTLVLTVLVLAIALQNLWLLFAIPVVGYGFAWVGHFFFDRNRPATFSHPFYSLLGDFVLFRDMLVGRIRF
ncbi:Mpo1-like protein [Povalibacter sp.]|uniref:Mpo1-like protein n=1 Tax=Povalibacter sp. TaxID=1962978 RepID=UPI002F41979A